MGNGIGQPEDVIAAAGLAHRDDLDEDQDDGQVGDSELEGLGHVEHHVVRDAAAGGGD